jgi:hypothetical protein
LAGDEFRRAHITGDTELQADPVVLRVGDGGTSLAGV